MLTSQTQPPRIAIIGAGLTGMFTATLLERAYAKADKNLQPTIQIFEKSAGVGRLATRYNQPNELSKEQYQFDFGAPFFTAKSKPFQDFIATWVQTGVLQPYLAAITYFGNDKDSLEMLSFVDDADVQEYWDTDKPRYISNPKMTSWGRTLAKDLNATQIQFKTRVASLDASSYDDKTGLTTLKNEQGNILGEFDWVICTAPSQQATELFEQSSFAHNATIQKVDMQACYVLMLGWRTPEQLPQRLKQAKWHIALSQNVNDKTQTILNEVFLEYRKPTRKSILPSVTIYASNEWSEQHVDDDIEIVIQALTKATAQLLDWTQEARPDYIDCHRWRYAATVNSATENKRSDAFVDATHNWIVAGDWCVEGRIESCFESAMSVVDSLNIV